MRAERRGDTSSDGVSCRPALLAAAWREQCLRRLSSALLHSHGCLVTVLKGLTVLCCWCGVGHDNVSVRNMNMLSSGGDDGDVGGMKRRRLD